MWGQHLINTILKTYAYYANIKQLWLFGNSHSSCAPLTLSHQQHLSNDNHPRSNLLKTTRQQYVKLQIALVEVWDDYDFDSCVESFSPPNVWFQSLSLNNIHSKRRTPLSGDSENIRVVMQAAVQVLKQSHKNMTSVNKETYTSIC